MANVFILIWIWGRCRWLGHLHFAFEFEFEFEFQRLSKTAHNNNNNNGRLWLRPRNAQKVRRSFFLSTESNNKLHSSTGRGGDGAVQGRGMRWERVCVWVGAASDGRWVTDASWPYLDAMLCLLIRSKEAAARDGRRRLAASVLHAAWLHEWRLARPPPLLGATSVTLNASTLILRSECIVEIMKNCCLNEF